MNSTGLIKGPADTKISETSPCTTCSRMDRGYLVVGPRTEDLPRKSKAFWKCEMENKHFHYSLLYLYQLMLQIKERYVMMVGSSGQNT